MIFITLAKFKQKHHDLIKGRKEKSEEEIAEIDSRISKWHEDQEKQGIKTSWYWTLGQYDVVGIIEAPTEKEAMKVLLELQDRVETETMVAVPRDEALKLL